jgi:hypothetical protein
MGLKGIGPGIGGHGSKLITIKLPVVYTVPFLTKEDRAPGLQSDDQGQQGGEPRQQSDDDQD